MLSIKPRSILQLTIIGFLAVAGLLIIALVSTTRQLDALAEQSERVVNQTVAAIRDGRILIEQATAMERNIRQYSILADREILKVYTDRRNAFLEAANRLSKLLPAGTMDGNFGVLLGGEPGIVPNGETFPEDFEPDEVFPALVRSTYVISGQIDDWTNRELDGIRKRTRDTQQVQTLQAILLVGTALVLAGIFTMLITGPLAQINKVIHQLGNGSCEQPVKIRGPADLVKLGERLDWLRERLNTLGQQRSAMLRHVSHELKTPLSAIQESAALLRDGVVGSLNDEQCEIIRIQHNNCQRLCALIDDLLRHNSESFSVLNIKAEAVRLDFLAEQVLSNQQLAIKARSLIVENQLEPVTVIGHAEQLRVIIDNLFSNAIRFSPEAGTITVSTSRSGSLVELDIIDQGMGVAPEEATRVFEAFYRGTSPDQDFYASSGLGLAIAEEYAKANNGEIVVLTGTGGHFSLRFPSAIDQD
jgi:two-component system, NtrC family, sensor histidine kinase GlrK